MISFGTSLTSAGENLQQISVANLVEMIKNPSDSIQTTIRRLRTMYAIDKKSYSVQKRTLPYFVCARFNPPNRKIEHFATTDYFVVDIDKLSEKNMTLTDVRTKIQADVRVMACFTSPSEDGLKVLFRLAEPCVDSNVYSVFYKVFVQKFSHEYGLNQVVDNVTSDVSRACFVSWDPQIYYNPNADRVDFSKFAPIDNIGMYFATQRETEKIVKEHNEAIAAEFPTLIEKQVVEPTKTEIDQIKEALTGIANRKKKYERLVHVPEQLDELETILIPKLEEQGVVIEKIQNIAYGKKIAFMVGQSHGEVIVYYSTRRGFSVVGSTKTGTDPVWNALMKDVVDSLICQLVYGS